MSDLEGYSGEIKELLESYGVDIGDEIELTVDGERYRGILIGRYELAEPGYIVIKLSNGYNIGIRIKDKVEIRKISEAKKPGFRASTRPRSYGALPKVTVIGTGGTIASRIDYRTGGVRPVLTTDDLLSVIPELSSIAELDTNILFSIFSEDMTQKEWSSIAIKVDEYIRKGVEGVVVAHGTDTMGYSAAALSFALQKPPIPIVLVGAQRSSDRPSSDSASNLMAAVKIAGYASFAEVCVAMHYWHSDDVIAIHRGTRVRKQHTSSRDAFKSINSEPIAFYRDGEIYINRKGLNPRGGNNYIFNSNFSDKASLLKFYPGMSSDILEALWSSGYRGIVIEGTGLGHVARRHIPVLEKMIKDGVFICMTSQCIYGRVNMRVYSTGRDLLKIGVTPLDDMLPETAYVKLSWVLAQSTDIDEIRRMMITEMAGEIGERSMPSKVRDPWE
ncbi:MAG: Glu-tRNA(Gln) amidotransferase subunit GatD [Candidatus Caldarchaeales archaeon]